MNDIDKNLKLWRERYDETIHTYDDKEIEEIIKNRCEYIFAKIEILLGQTDKKAVEKATKNLIDESLEYYEAYHKATEENKKKDFYQDLKKASHYATAIRASISDIFELKNRRSVEIFKLRAENSKLRIELNNLKNNINGNN